jgi:small redox-active disulfide protein 2
MKSVKVLGTGCSKCNITYQNALEAIKRSGIEAEVSKIEDIMHLMELNVLTTPVLMIDGVQLIKGRVADVNEIIELLKK